MFPLGRKMAPVGTSGKPAEPDLHTVKLGTDQERHNLHSAQPRLRSKREPVNRYSCTAS